MTESRPVPQFYNQTLLTKKTKYNSTPFNNSRKAQPPRPCKSISPKSFYRFSLGSSNSSFKAQAVSFKENTANQSILSKYYDENCNEPYFNQCFEVLSDLGSGFFGDVFKVKSKEDGKFYAVKKSRERFKGVKDRDQKLQEVAKHENLPAHPNLVKFYKAWEEQQRLYIQIELCECSLSKFADLNHDIPEKVIWNFLIDMLQALDHLHSHNLLHLDIKPENIFISKDGIYKLGDFGLVVDSNKLNFNSNEPLEGDPKYLAKETMDSRFTKAADIFSLGITTLELACDLDLPTGGENWHLLRDNFDKIPDKYFKRISPELKHIIKMMMHSNYKLRPSANELLNYPIIKNLRKKRNLKNTIRSTSYKVIDGFINFFISLFNILFIFKLIDYLKSFNQSTDQDINKTTPIFKKDSSFSHQLQSPFFYLFSSKKDSFTNNFNTNLNNNEINQITSPLDSSINLNKRNLRSSTINKLQDLTINNSAHVNLSLINNNNQISNLNSRSPNSDITPPMHSFNNFIQDNAELQSTTHRSLKSRKQMINTTSLGNHSFLNADTNFNFSSNIINSGIDRCETPIKKGTNFYDDNDDEKDDSPTSIYFSKSFNKTNLLNYSSSEEDEIENELNKKEFSFNYTGGQRNLSKVFDSVDDN